MNGYETAIGQGGEGKVPVVFAQADQRLSQAGDGGLAAQGGQAARIGGTVEQSQQTQDGELPHAVFSALGQPFLVSRHGLEGVAALDLRVRLGEVHFPPLSHVAQRLLNKAAKQL